VYDSALGRWISEDPIRFQGDGVNMFSYVINRPVVNIDILGLQRVPVLGPKTSDNDAIRGTSPGSNDVGQALANGIQWAANLLRDLAVGKAIREGQARNLPMNPDGSIYQPWVTRRWYPPDPADKPSNVPCIKAPSKNPCNTWPNGCWYPPYPPGVIPEPHPELNGQVGPQWVAKK
jgi:hypothetical protein